MINPDLVKDDQSSNDQSQVTIEKTGEITSESAKIAQQETDDYLKKVQEMSAAGFTFDNISYVTMKEGQQVADAQSRDLVVKYYEVFSKMKMKISAEQAPEEIAVVKNAETAAKNAKTTVESEKERLAALEAKPTRGFFNKIYNAVTGLERKKREAQEDVAKANSYATLAERNIEEAVKKAAEMKKERRLRMTMTDFNLELIEVTKELQTMNQQGKKQLEGSLGKVTKQKVESKAKLTESDKKLQSLQVSIKDKQAELEKERTNLTEQTKGTPEYGSVEIRVAELDSELKNLNTDLATETAVNTRLSSDILSYINSETSANDQIAAFKVRLTLLEMNLKHMPIITEMAMNSMKAGDSLQASSNQAKTHNALELVSVSQIGTAGGQALNSELDAINDETEQNDKLIAMTEQLEAMRKEKTTSLNDAISKALNK
jgi:hypothetical protein